MTPKYTELVDALEEMCRQHCFTDFGGEVDSQASSANADALRILSRCGRFTIIDERNRIITGRWKRKK